MLYLMLRVLTNLRTLAYGLERHSLAELIYISEVTLKFNIFSKKFPLLYYEQNINTGTNIT